MADFHKCLSDDYYQDPLMGNRVVASFDVDQVVLPSRHRQLCRAGRVPHFRASSMMYLVGYIQTSTSSPVSFARNKRGMD